MLGILPFLPLNAKPFHVVLCLGFNFCHGDVFSNCHKLAIALAGLVNFNNTHINARHINTKIFFQSLFDIVLDCIIYLSGFALKLDDRDIMGRRSTCNSVFHIASDCISNLFLKIFKAKILQPIQLDKFFIIANLKADCSPDGYRHTKVQKTGIIDIKKWNAKLDLNDSSQIDEVDFCLER